MLTTRVIPCLLWKNAGFVKTERFRNARYLGDPINIVKIFNEKEVDEIIIVDITATIENRPPRIKELEKIVSECFMPVCYGGGIRSVENAKEILNVGVEKVAINSAAIEDPLLVRRTADIFGSQSTVSSIDVSKSFRGMYDVVTRGGSGGTGLDPVSVAMEMEEMGAGEILLNSVERDGTMQGYDIELIKRVSDAVSVPVIACGGAGQVRHFRDAVDAGASAVAAGSMFVFQGKYRAVLISYPSEQELFQVFS